MPWTAATRRAVLTLRERGASIADVARETGVPPATISRWTREARRAARRRRDARIREARRAGVGVGEIAAQESVHPETVRRALRDGVAA